MPRRQVWRTCQCGCGGTTGRFFCPGHDQRHRGNLLRSAAAGNADAQAELERRGWLTTHASRAVRRSAGSYQPLSPRPSTQANSPLNFDQAAGRRFGTEIEFIGSYTVVDNLVREMRSRGLQINSETYNHHTRPHWKIVPDGSLQGRGQELVSPPLQGDDGFHQLRMACEALAAAGATVERICGLHVHHEASDLDGAEMLRVINLWATSQTMVDQVLPMSRRSVSHPFYCGPWSEHELRSMRYQTNPADIVRCQEGRYRSMNLAAYSRYQTIEIRQHSGTIEYEKIANWVRLGQAVIETGKVGTAVSFDDLEAWMTSIGLDDEVRAFFQGRRESFNTRIARAAAREERQAARDREHRAAAEVERRRQQAEILRRAEERQAARAAELEEIRARREASDALRARQAAENEEAAELNRQLEAAVAGFQYSPPMDVPSDEAEWMPF